MMVLSGEREFIENEKIMTRSISRLICILLIASTQAQAKGAEPTMPAAEFTFDQYEVVIGSGERQTVLTGFLLGGAVADLAVVNIDENGDRRLRIYVFDDGSWVPRLGTTLRPEVLFVDVANIGG
ncbi:MAG: hypothetical protein F4184_06015, partial [Gemmatimonadetes bacterium]|nr:hypothetical protein [Gemmatimonadota bacterium]